MNSTQLHKLQFLAADSQAFYLSCKSAAIKFDYPYPDQYADRIRNGIKSGEWSSDVERVAAEVIASSEATAQ
ncbi:hypothetical protein NDI52_28510 [Leptolyngbya sp. PL-A3]|uniref:hypothetical protein n=1 Tax=Leptolyngbya sp. PL-A3 TaxID=2933911 RepID=UPI00329A4281